MAHHHQSWGGLRCVDHIPERLDIECTPAEPAAGVRERCGSMGANHVSPTRWRAWSPGSAHGCCQSSVVKPGWVQVESGAHTSPAGLFQRRVPASRWLVASIDPCGGLEVGLEHAQTVCLTSANATRVRQWRSPPEWCPAFRPTLADGLAADLTIRLSIRDLKPNCNRVERGQGTVPQAQAADHTRHATRV